MRTGSNFKPLIAVAALVLAVVSAVTVAYLTRASADAADKASPDFAVLSEGATPRLIDAEQRVLGSLAALHPEFGLHTGRARIATTSAGMKLLAVPADERICLVILQAADGRTFAPATCKPVAEANREGVLLRLGDNSPFTVAGLVPDGVDAVDLVFADGSREHLDVTHNGYFGTARDTQARLSFSLPDGTIVTQALSIS